MIFEAVLCECFGCPSFGLCPGVPSRHLFRLLLLSRVLHHGDGRALELGKHAREHAEIFAQTFLYWAVLPGFIG